MTRREALAALSGLAIVPVTTRETHGVELVVFKSPRKLSPAQVGHIRDAWAAAVQGTAVAHAKCLILSDGLDVEFVKTK